ncbi:MAG: T9SS type A sorting domain-containing protein [Saprospiraceae bacterium]|nr:T9SS type A sorting domain-containing protein [Saprospiraceae bacterium]
MKYFQFVIILAFFQLIGDSSYAQCNQTLTINSYSADCNGNGTSTVTINVTVLFGNGNNSATISYNLGAGEVNAVVLEDDAGDLIDQEYTFDVMSCENFNVTLTGWTNPSGSGSSCTDPAPVTVGIILPVTFGDFTVIKSTEGILLEWNTFSEINNEKFVIQRSADGKEFSSIGEVKGAGDSVKEEQYMFVDSDPLRGTFYYRLQQVDRDGTYAYSDTRSIKVDHASQLSVYPNPSQDYVVVASSSVESYLIFDMQGRLVKEIDQQETSTRIDVSQLRKGMYTVRGMTSQTSITFLKQ